MSIKGIVRVWILGLWFVISGVLAGCQYTGWIYKNTTLPVSWVSNTRLDVQDLALEEQEITGQSTNYILMLGLFSWGNAGLEAALQNARQNAGFEIREVYDVKTDQRIFNILGLYSSLTTIVKAKVAR
ncbi:MAG: TRL domain-containing protein [Nitrospiria bacterium]